MPLPNFDSSKHHVGLGPSGGTLKGYVLSGAYLKTPQRNGAPSEFGGDRDQIEPSILSRWTQDDFSGGAYQEIWGTDEAMFAWSRGMLPSLMERSARTVPPLVYWLAAGKPDAASAVEVFATNRQIAVVRDTGTSFYDAETGAGAGSINTSVNKVQAAAHFPADNFVYTIQAPDAPADGSDFELRRWKAGGSQEIISAMPASYKGPAKGMEITGGKDVIVQMGPMLVLADVNEQADGATWSKVGRLPGNWKDSVTYNGQTFILLTDLEQTTQVVSWDGSQILPVVSFPYNFIGTSIAVYGGRLYVGGAGQDIAGDDKYAELYEITGSSLRLIRSFAPEIRAGDVGYDDATNGLTSWPSSIYALTVHEGILYAASNSGYLIAYDLTRDALFGGPQIISDPDPTALRPKFLLSTREKLFAYCDDPAGAGPTFGDGFYRLATTGADVPGGGYDGQLYTSNFAHEPDRDKAWSQLRLLTRFGGVTVDVSVDGGSTWAALTPVETVSGSFYTTDFDLTSVARSKHIRFRYTFHRTDVGYTELVAHTLTLIYLDNGKRVWQFTVAGAAKIEQLDDSSLVQDTAALATTLEDFWLNRTLCDFTDPRGSTAKVFVTDISEAQPVIAPALPDGSREAFFAVTLTEV